MQPESDRELCYRSPLGVLGLRVCAQGLSRVWFLPRDDEAQGYEPAPAAIARDLDRYFRDPGHRFTLALFLSGTPFQERIWRLLSAIPPGRVITYGELARRAESGPRAVAGACAANPLPVVVPCHRVVAIRGLGGYMGGSGRGLAIKRWLLRHEHAIP